MPRDAASTATFADVLAAPIQTTSRLAKIARRAFATMSRLTHTLPGEPKMQRLNYLQTAPDLFKKFVAFNLAVKESSIEATTHNLVTIRASQLNGCTFCLDMHVKQARLAGERELRIYHVAAWRESTLFAPRERAALAWTEILTNLPPQGVPDDIYERVRGQLSEKEITDLTFAIMAINSWNRLNVAFKTVPGSADATFGLDKAGLK
jgi:AhpD family alkylhydroperoxidase